MKQENSAYRVKMIKRKKTWVSMGTTTLAFMLATGGTLGTVVKAEVADWRDELTVGKEIDLSTEELTSDAVKQRIGDVPKGATLYIEDDLSDPQNIEGSVSVWVYNPEDKKSRVVEVPLLQKDEKIVETVQENPIQPQVTPIEVAPTEKLPIPIKEEAVKPEEGALKVEETSVSTVMTDSEKNQDSKNLDSLKKLGSAIDDAKDALDRIEKIQWPKKEDFLKVSDQEQEKQLSYYKSEITIATEREKLVRDLNTPKLSGHKTSDEANKLLSRFDKVIGTIRQYYEALEKARAEEKKRKEDEAQLKKSKEENKVFLRNEGLKHTKDGEVEDERAKKEISEIVKNGIEGIEEDTSLELVEMRYKEAKIAIEKIVKREKELKQAYDKVKQDIVEIDSTKNKLTGNFEVSELINDSEIRGLLLGENYSYDSDKFKSTLESSLDKKDLEELNELIDSLQNINWLQN